MPRNLVATVAGQTELGSGYHLLRLHAPEIAQESRAGQFVMLGLPAINQMLIRRPFSVARLTPSPSKGKPRELEVLYKVFGSATHALSRLRAGDLAAVLGPLGTGFTIPPESTEIVMVAGGIGNAIFPLLLQELGERAKATTLVFGGRTHSDLTLLDWFETRCRVLTCTEDGSAGEKGRVTAPLARYLEVTPTAPRVVMACGPHPMLKAVAELCESQQVPCQLAMEETMACGFGVCLGCVVPRRHPEDEFGRFVRVCCEGPVFDSREIAL